MGWLLLKLCRCGSNVHYYIVFIRSSTWMALTCEILSKSTASLGTAKETTLIHLALLSDSGFLPVILFAAIQASELGTSLRFVLPLLSSLFVRRSLTMTSLNFCSVYPLWFLNSNSMCSALEYCCKGYNPKGQAGVILKMLFYAAVQSMTLRIVTRTQGPCILFLWATEDTGVTQMSFCHQIPFGEKLERLAQMIFRGPFHPGLLCDCSMPVLQEMLRASSVCPPDGTSSLMLVETSPGFPGSSCKRDQR